MRYVRIFHDGDETGGANMMAIIDRNMREAHSV
jgi:hypothetical protein